MAQMGNGRWITTYEVGLFPTPGAAPYGVHYSLFDNPNNIEGPGSKANILLKAANSGTIPSASPFVQWTPAGGINGTVIVSDGSYESLWLNTQVSRRRTRSLVVNSRSQSSFGLSSLTFSQYGAPHAWVEVPNVHGVGYSPSLMVMPDESEIMIFNGGNIYGANPNASSYHLCSMYHVTDISHRVLRLLPAYTWCRDRSLLRTPSLAAQHNPRYEGTLQ